MVPDGKRLDVNRRSATAVVLGLALSVSIVAGIVGSGAPLVASTAGLADDVGAVPVGIADGDSSDTQPMAEFPWGTVTHETDPETGEPNVDVTVEDADNVSISVTAAPDAADGQKLADADSEVETERFSWGVVTHATDPETGETDVDVTIEAEADVSVSVTAESDDGTQSESTIVTSMGDVSSNATVSQSSETSNSTSTTTVSQSTTVSSGTSIDIDDG